MSTKQESKSWDNVPFKTWKYEKQTEMKHKVFSYYMPIWLQVLNKWNKNLNYIDGFGGIGAYHNDEDLKSNNYISNKYGSPVLSILKILELEKDKKINKANVIVIDEDHNNLENVKNILKFHEIDVSKKILFIEGDFDNEINKILDKIDKIAPTFFLLDPFGISGIKLSTIKRIMERGKTEILLNFMYNTLQRFVSHPNEKINKIYDEYFGGDEWRKCTEKRLTEKENELVSIFRKNCKIFCKFVYPFKLKFPNKNQTYYYLFHLTQHRKGCSLMKDSFAKFNNGNDKYIGENYQSNLLEPLNKKEKNENFEKKLIDKYKGKKINYVEVLGDFIDETDLLEKDIKKILNKLEESKVKVIPFNGRKRKTGFADNDILLFSV